MTGLRLTNGALTGNMNEHRFEFIEHTADIGVQAQGETLAEAFENAAYGMISAMASIEGLESDRRVEVRLEASDVQTLLHKWLSELIYRTDVEMALPVSFKVTEATETSLVADVGMRRIGPDIEFHGPPIKAVTYHQLKVEKTTQGWVAKAIFDV